MPPILELLTLRRRSRMEWFYDIIQVFHFMVVMVFLWAGLVEFIRDPPFFDAYGDAATRNELPEGLFENDPRSLDKMQSLRLMDIPILFMLLVYVGVCWLLKFRGLSWLLTFCFILTLTVFFFVNYWESQLFDWRYFLSRNAGLEVQVVFIALTFTSVFIVLFYERKKLPFKFKRVTLKSLDLINQALILAPYPTLMPTYNIPILHPYLYPYCTPLLYTLALPMYHTPTLHPCSTRVPHPYSTPLLYPCYTPTLHPCSTHIPHPYSTPLLYPYSTPLLYTLSLPMYHTPTLHPCSTHVQHSYSTSLLYPCTTLLLYTLALPMYSTPFLYPCTTLLLYTLALPMYSTPFLYPCTTLLLYTLALPMYSTPFLYPCTTPLLYTLALPMYHTPTLHPCSTHVPHPYCTPIYPYSTPLLYTLSLPMYHTPTLHPCSTHIPHPYSTPLLYPCTTLLLYTLALPIYHIPTHPFSTHVPQPYSTPLLYPCTTALLYTLSLPMYHTPTLHPCSTHVPHPYSTLLLYPYSTPLLYTLALPIFHTPTLHPCSTHVQCYPCSTCSSDGLKHCVKGRHDNMFHCLSDMMALPDKGAFCLFNYNISAYTFMTVFAYVGGLVVFLSNFLRIVVHYFLRFVFFFLGWWKVKQNARDGHREPLEGSTNPLHVEEPSPPFVVLDCSQGEECIDARYHREMSSVSGLGVSLDEEEASDGGALVEAVIG
ncbi:predicted protein [Nematostella vectensis]|uniref:Uncharacterized protein n=1 Tax=Nematostella vectensis TaxID=45351 RepID=A7T0J9_NEMVE|nr:predicted protein [Nematostella vectensis]|eukprot:XP_001622619.1 predicted protein [Nematostella vectensis]